MLGSFRLGSLFGFPIRVNYSFLLMLALVLLATGGATGTTGLFIVLLAFGGVLLHELGHAVMARRLGVPIKEIELNFFGGAAKMMGLPRSAGDEIAIAAAGPAVSIMLSGLGYGLHALTGLWLFSLIGAANLLIGLFNLLPALPMDGGRILRALLSRRLGFLRATEVAVKIARVFAVGLGVAGLFTGHFLWILLAVMLWTMGFAELLAARFRHHETQFSDPWQAARHRHGEPIEAEYLPPGHDDRPPPSGTFKVFFTRP